MRVFNRGVREALPSWTALTPDCEGAMGTEETKVSLWREPGTSQPPKPEPISKPLVAGMLSIACANMASSLSKTGSPRPTGQLRITHVTVPPMLSFLSLYSAIIFAIRSEASLLGQRTGKNSSTWERVIDPMRSRKTGLVEAVG